MANNKPDSFSAGTDKNTKKINKSLAVKSLYCNVLSNEALFYLKIIVDKTDILDMIKTVEK